jgi:hypothetical protein
MLFSKLRGFVLRIACENSTMQGYKNWIERKEEQEYKQWKEEVGGKKQTKNFINWNEMEKTIEIQSA